MSHIVASYIHELHNRSGFISKVRANLTAIARREAAEALHRELLDHPQFSAIDERAEGTVLTFVAGPLPHGVLMRRRQGENNAAFFARAYNHCERAALRRNQPPQRGAAFTNANLEELL